MEEGAVVALRTTSMESTDAWMKFIYGNRSQKVELDG